MKTFIEQATFYSHYHQHKTTVYTHLLGVPLVIFAVMIFFGYFHLLVPNVFHTTIADILTLIVAIYYIRLNWRLGLLVFPVLLLLLWLSYLLSFSGPTALNVWIMVLSFALGLLLQLAGHWLEGSKPAFFVSIKQALVAPLFLVAELLFMAGYMPKLREELHGPITESVTPVVDSKAPDSSV